LLRIEGDKLTIADVLDVALACRKVSLSRQARNRVMHARKTLEKLVNEGRIIYGVNTGFGRFAEISIPRNDIQELQRNIVLSHAAGVGPLLSEDIVRAAMLLKANGLASGYSGVRPVVIDTLLAMLNAGIHPEIPSQGSVGASGDLAPLAHLVLVGMGMGQASVNGRSVHGGKALSQAGIKPLVLEAKEGLALLNGTQVMTAAGVVALNRSQILFQSADIIGAMSCEALSGSPVPYDPRIHALRPHRGQGIVAENMRNLLARSEILAERPFKRVQEAYSLRCIPQVHGAGRDVVAYAQSVLDHEINAVTDNPIIFADDREVLTGGNFHGEPLALAFDAMAMAVASLGAISERRIAYLIDHDVSGLPGFLIKKQGLNSGFMIAQVTAADLVAENKVLSHPNSVDSLPTSANQEDYVSMGMASANKLLHVIRNTEYILAIELLCSCQGVDLRKPLRPGPVLNCTLKAFRHSVSFLETDRMLTPDIEEARLFIHRKKLLNVVNKHTVLK